MKKFIYIFGIILLNIFAFGAIFKVMHWPGASILLSLGLGLFALIFLPLAFVNNYRGVGKKQLSLHVAGFVCAIICVIGALFKIQHWPGAGWFLIIGVPLPFFYFLPVYLHHHNKEKDKSVINFLGIMFLMLYISVFSALLALSVSRDIIGSMAISAEDNAKTTQLYVAKNNLKYEEIKSKGNAVTQKEAEAIKLKTQELCNKIDSIKKELILNTEGDDTKVIADNVVDYDAIGKLDETGVPELIMRGDDGISGRAPELKKLFKSYYEFLISVLKDKSSALTINQLLNTPSVKDTLYQNGIIEWEDVYFQHGTFLINTLDKLECLQLRVKMAEAEALECFVEGN